MDSRPDSAADSTLCSAQTRQLHVAIRLGGAVWSARQGRESFQPESEQGSGYQQAAEHPATAVTAAVFTGRLSGLSPALGAVSNCFIGASITLTRGMRIQAQRGSVVCSRLRCS